MRLSLLSLLAFSSSGACAHQFLSRLQSFALRHSAGVARDLRFVFENALLSPPHNLSSQKPTCVVKRRKSTSSIPTPTSKPTSKPTTTLKPPPTPSGPSWKLVQLHQGQSFFDGWNFWTSSDPTGGCVQYVGADVGWNQGLLSINDQGNAVMRVETTPVINKGYRKAIRIHSKRSFTGGLVIFDAVHMPTGCGTWPAFWSNGPNWPNGGEIDIVEGVHNNVYNIATIHTGRGCTLSANYHNFTGTLSGGTNCAAYESNDSGCNIKSSQPNSFGAAFNQIGGGVYAMRWDNKGIAVWWFNRTSIPHDIASNSSLRPEQWGQADAQWPGANCNPFQYFYKHIAILNTALCGQWAGAVWANTCAASTGFGSCEEYVRTKGSAFREAYWEVKYVKIYQWK